jgi:hypothetical protein
MSRSPPVYEAIQTRSIEKEGRLGEHAFKLRVVAEFEVKGHASVNLDYLIMDIQLESSFVYLRGLIEN